MECTRFGFKELDISGKIPRSMDEAMQYEDVDRQTQYHLHYGRGVTSMGGQIVSAHGDEVREPKEFLLRFFLLIDRGLQREFLHDETAPLVMVAVDYLFPIYRQANTYDNLLDKIVKENPEKLTPFELHQQALSIIMPYFQARQEEAVRLYGEYAGNSRSTSNIRQIVADSYSGKIYKLIVAADRQQWGNYDPVKNKVKIHPKEKRCDLDLLDYSAAHTLLHRGDVYTVSDDKVPGGGLVAAVLRY